MDLGSAATGTNVTLGSGNPNLTWNAPTTWGADGHDYLDDPAVNITADGLSTWLATVNAENPSQTYDSYTVTIRFYSDVWWADGSSWDPGWGQPPNLRYSGNYNGNGAQSVDSGLLTFSPSSPANVRDYTWTSPLLSGDTFTFTGGPRTWDGSTDWRSSVDSITFNAIPEPSVALSSLLGVLCLVRRQRRN